MTAFNIALGAAQWRAVHRNMKLRTDLFYDVDKVAAAFQAACKSTAAPPDAAATVTVEMNRGDAMAVIKGLTAPAPVHPSDDEYHTHQDLFAGGVELTVNQERIRDRLSAEHTLACNVHERRHDLAISFLSLSVTQVNGKPFAVDAEELASVADGFADKINNMETIVVQEHRDAETRESAQQKLHAQAILRELEREHADKLRDASVNADVSELLDYAAAAERLGSTANMDWLVQDFIPARSIAFLAAPPFGHKSFTAVHLGLCIAAGLPWLGRPVKQGAVIYVAGEASESIYRRRNAAKQAMGADDAPFYIMPRPVLLTDEYAVKVFIATAVALAGGEPIAAVFLDTWSDMKTAVDENNAGKMSEVIANAKIIRDGLGAALIPLHHVNAAGDLRGSTTQAAAADVIMSVTHKQGVLAIRCEDARDFAPGAMAYADVEEIAWGDGTTKILKHREAGPATRIDGDKEAGGKRKRTAKVALPEQDSDWLGVLATLRNASGAPVDGDAWFDAAVPPDTAERSVYRGRWRKAYARLDKAGSLTRDGETFDIVVA